MKLLKENFANLLATLIVVMCFGYFFWASFFLSPVEKDLTHIAEIKTALIGVVMLIVGYYFGSSKSSSNKDAVIRQMSETQNSIAQGTNNS